MDHIKLFEAYFSDKDILYEILDYEKCYQFESRHKRVDISKLEFEKINRIFNTDTLELYSKRPWEKGFNDKFDEMITTKQGIYASDILLPFFIYKFEDDWWTLRMSNRNTSSHSMQIAVLCDRIEGIEEYKNSKDYEKY